MKKILTFLIIFMSIFTTKVYAASNIDIIDAKVIEKSSTITVEDPVLENNTISSNVKFNQINDYVIYELTLKNNDSYDYKVDEVVDNNTNNNLLIEYDYSEKLLSSGNGTLRIKLTYKNKLLNVDKITLDNLEIKMNLTKSDGSKSQVSITSPKTGDNIVKYLLLLIISIVGIVLTKKNIKFKKIKVGNMLLIVSILLIPFTIFAAEKFEIKIKFSDVEVKGEFEVYDIEIGDTTKEITYGQKIGELPEPEKTGYTFVKWVDEDGNTVTSDTVVTKPLTLTPKYQIIEYTITYNLKNGSATNETKYTINDEFTLNNPTKDGYTFSGWTGSNGNNLQTSVTIQKGTIGNLTFNANYSANQNTPYKVVHKYEKLGGGYDEETQNLTGATGSKVTPQVIGRTGFNSPQPEEITISGTGNTILEYVYTRINYLVTLNNSEYINTTATTGNYPYGTQLTLQAIDREGYNFTGWSNGNNNEEITLTVTNAITIEPLYELITHTVTFNANEGLVGETSRVVNYNEPVGELPTATKVGQSFTGWYNGNTLVDETFVPTQDVTLNAHYIVSVDSLNITNEDIEVIKGQNQTINITNSNDIEETYTFTSNDEQIATVNQNGVVVGVNAGTTTITITGDTSNQIKTVNVTVIPATYTVTFDPTDGQVTQESISVDQGDTINSFPTPTREGYDFAGWYNGSTLVETPYTPTQDITLTAHWEESNSLITNFDSDEDGSISLGDYVKLGDDGFYVIGTENGYVKLLAEYNLDSDSRQSIDNYTQVSFSDSNYWVNDAGSSSGSDLSEYYQGYDVDEDGYPYIYRNNNDEDTANNLYPYINNYKDYLINDVGINIEDARLMSHKEALSTGCEYNNVGICPEYIANQFYYWLGSAVGSDFVWGGGVRGLGGGNYYINGGVRPVIIIDEELLSEKLTISFDTKGGSKVSNLEKYMGTEIGNLPYSSKDDYVLEGWYTDENYTNRLTPSTKIYEDITAYAKWVTPGGIEYTDSDEDGSISLGDYVKIGEDGFYVIDNPTNGQVKLLAEYNLDSDSRQSEDNYTTEYFSNSNYWWDDNNGDYYDKYETDEDGYGYVYRTNTGKDTKNNLYPYINNYKDYLLSLGKTNIIDARLMSYQEALSTGCKKYYSVTCPEYIVNQDYWLGSAFGDDCVWNVNYYDVRDLSGNDYGDYSGVRPVIIISESSISTP